MHHTDQKFSLRSKQRFNRIALLLSSLLFLNQNSYAFELKNAIASFKRLINVNVEVSILGHDAQIPGHQYVLGKRGGYWVTDTEYKLVSTLSPEQIDDYLHERLRSRFKIKDETGSAIGGDWHYSELFGAGRVEREAARLKDSSLVFSLKKPIRDPSVIQMEMEAHKKLQSGLPIWSSGKYWEHEFAKWSLCLEKSQAAPVRYDHNYFRSESLIRRQLFVVGGYFLGKGTAQGVHSQIWDNIQKTKGKKLGDRIQSSVEVGTDFINWQEFSADFLVNIFHGLLSVETKVRSGSFVRRFLKYQMYTGYRASWDFIVYILTPVQQIRYRMDMMSAEEKAEYESRNVEFTNGIARAVAQTKYSLTWGQRSLPTYDIIQGLRCVYPQNQTIINGTKLFGYVDEVGSNFIFYFARSRLLDAEPDKK